jgi:hypothetical protein
MEQVRFFELTDDGYEVAGRAVLRDGVVVFEGVTKERLLSLDVGISNPLDPPPRDQFFPKDGIKFLELLPGRFRGSYCHASSIEEVK